MARALFGSVVVLALFAAVALCDDAKDSKKTTDAKAKKYQAKVVKVDAKKGTVTLKWKNKAGKEMEKTFTLAEDIRYLDSTGRVAAVDVFTSGNEVLVVEREGKISEMKKHEKKDKTETKDKDTGKKK
jgi:uncharacterized protein YigE (DUF2233 family)